MAKGVTLYWRKIAAVEKVFFLALILYVVLYFSGAVPTLRSVIGLVAFVLGLASLFHLSRVAMRKAIWRLRNRLIAAYLFIAVVPVFLILALAAIGGWVIIGQMAVYLVSTELQHREGVLQRQAEILARIPVRDTDAAVNRFVMATRVAFPECLLRISGQEDLRYPPGAQVDEPPAEWRQEKQSSGLVIRREGVARRLYAWAHATGQNGNDVTILAPVTHDVLANIIPGLGDINFMPLLGHIPNSHIPPPSSLLDIQFNWGFPVSIPFWDTPKEEERQLLAVTTRPAAVLGIIFGQEGNWSEIALVGFIAVMILFLVVELFSLVAGVQLTRSITGAVHEIYQGTQHIKEGDFSYRIPVNGSDQLAELATSFNGMTENLGRLIVVAKEKERLESELAIAREVQNQLFPKDVPSSRTLELRGVCCPARMVSGDYYDFVALSDHEIAFAIGDVAGKGISAALLMATIQSTMRTQLSAMDGAGAGSLSTARLVSNLNRQLYATTAPEKYATFYFALYEEPTHSLKYTNAGHLAPILLRNGDAHCLGSTGTVVGAFPFARYEERSIPLDHGDIVVAYTDGVVEPENAYGEMFGEERLKDLLLKYSKADSSEIIARTMEAVNEWTGTSELQDDMTMVVARRV